MAATFQQNPGRVALANTMAKSTPGQPSMGANPLIGTGGPNVETAPNVGDIFSSYGADMKSNGGDWWQNAISSGQSTTADLEKALGAQGLSRIGNQAGPNGYSASVVGDANPRPGMEGLPGIDTTTVDYNTLPGLDTDFSAMGDRVRNARFSRTTGLLNPEYDRARESTAQRLANAGIVEGSERWTEEMGRLDQQRDLSLERSSLDADIASGDEMSRLFTQALQARQQIGGERERGADRRYTQTLGARGQLAGERLTQGGIDAQIAAANAQAGATASGHALQAAQAAAANDIARGRLGLDQDEQGFSQWLRAGTFARGGVNMPDFGTPIPLDVTGAAGVAQSGANAAAQTDASRNAGYAAIAAQLLGQYGKGGNGGKVGYQ